MVYALRVWPVKRRVVKQESVAYAMPPPYWGSWPRFETNEEREAWIREEYAAYPEYIELVLRGAKDFADD